MRVTVALLGALTVLVLALASRRRQGGSPPPQRADRPPAVVVEAASAGLSTQPVTQAAAREDPPPLAASVPRTRLPEEALRLDTRLHVGRVLAPDGAPVAGALVSGYPVRTGAWVHALTDAGGGFRFTTRLEGDWSAGDFTGPYEPDAVEERVHAVAIVDGVAVSGSAVLGSNTTIRLGTGARSDRFILQRLVDVEGAPVDVAFIGVACGSEDARAFVRSRSSGWYVHSERWFPEDASQDLLLLIRVAASWDGSPLRLAPTVIRVPRLATWSRYPGRLPDVVLAPGRTMGGRVVHANGDPATGTRVTIIPPEPAGLPSTQHWLEEESLRTDDDGAFAFQGLCAGVATLVVSVGDRELLRSDVQSGVSAVVLRLPAARRSQDEER